MKTLAKIVTIVLMISAFAISGISTASYGANADLFVLSEYTVDEPGAYFTLEVTEDAEISTVISSNNNVVSVRDPDYPVDGSFVFLYAEKPGTATITATDSGGNTDTCKVTVKPPVLVLDAYEINFEVYRGDQEYRVYSDTNDLSSVVSSNKSVVTVRLSETNCFVVTPVAKGTAIITVTDVYKQKATINVSVKQKYVDDMKYLDEFKSDYPDVVFGDDHIDFSIGFTGVSVQVRINNKAYTGRYNGDGTYYVDIPKVPAGTTIYYTLRKGESSYSNSVKVSKANIDDVGDISLSKSNYSYSGKTYAPGVSVYNGMGDYDLKKGTDYTVTYKNNRNVGIATVVVKGKGNYTGTLTKTFTIVPKGTVIKKVTAKKKGFTVKWKRQAAKMATSRVTGYQIRYSLKKNMKGAKTVNVRGYKKTSKTITKLKAKKRYYVQIRTYKKIGSKNYCSSWSKVKKVKTK